MAEAKRQPGAAPESVDHTVCGDVEGASLQCCATDSLSDGLSGRVVAAV